ncbi:MAG TPA: cache domain-containing protein [Roseiflexaceae bacterium]|nr:cache domain-containing protein [Roseiflexaceae bacterium]
MNITQRIGPRLIFTVVLFLIVLGLVTSGLLVNGLRQANSDAAGQSRAALIDQKQQSLVREVAYEGQLSDTRFQQSAAAARHTVAAMRDAVRQGLLPQVVQDQQLARQPDGYYADARPGRRSDTFLPAGVAVDPQVQRSLRESAVLDSLFPSILRENADVVAAYFIDPRGFARYYPVVDLASLIADDPNPASAPFFTIGAPEANPARNTVWTEPYLDPAGQGLLVTAATPVYEGDTFLGVFSIDVSLQRLISRLESFKPTPSSYALLLSRDGKLIATTQAGLSELEQTGLSASDTLTSSLGLDLTQLPSAPLQAALERLREGKQGADLLTIGQREVLLAYAPLSNVDWRLAVVTPVADIAGPADQLAATLGEETQSAIGRVLVALLVFMVLALLLALLLSRRLTQPISALITGTRAIAAGKLDQPIQIRSGGELGELAQAFNAMIADLGRARHQLEQSNVELERLVSERTATLNARTEQLQHSLDMQQQLNETIAALSVPVLPVHRDSIVVPLIGALDAQRAERLLTSVLEAVQERRSRWVVLDLTGMAVVDTATAQIILQTAAAVRLLGADVMLVGIRPEVAQTLVSLGADLGSLRSAATLQEGMERIGLIKQ